MKKPQWMIMANAMGIGVRTYMETNVTVAYPDYQGEIQPREKGYHRRMVRLWCHGFERTLVNPSSREIGQACRSLIIEAVKTGRITE